MTSKHQLVPRRAYGSALNSSRLTPTVPILGLGCSSFSVLFHSKKRLASLQKELHIQNEDDLSWITRDNPTVQGWVKTIQHAVLNCGVNLLDTAPWYGNGGSEIVIGYAVENLLDKTADNKIKREDIIINTKVGRYSPTKSKMFDFSAKRIRESVHMSLERLQCEYIDVLQLHDPEYSPSIELLLEETIPEMDNLRKEGKVKAIGMTGYPLQVQREIIERSRHELGIDLDQSLTYCHYNLHDQSLFSPLHPPSKYSNTRSFAEMCQKYGVGLICAAPLSMGLLTDASPPFWHPASMELKKACQDAAQLCKENGVQLARLAVAYALSNENVKCTLLGVKSVEELDQAVEIANLFHDCGEEGRCEQISLLRRVLTEKEFSVMLKLLDEKYGPFAEVKSSGKFQWDEVARAERFWGKVEGGKIGAEEQMRMK